LWAASLPYGWATRLRNRLYDRGWKPAYRVAVPVVSVGNLTLGGTGKTPFVEYVAAAYQRWGHRVALLSRGYGGRGGLNDEAQVLQTSLPDVPHLQGPDRVALAERAVREFGVEVLVLDDGFQHRRLARDLDIVLVDATQPWGHGRLFPRGLLREDPASLRRANLVALTRCDQVAEKERGRLREVVSWFAPHVPVVETAHRPAHLIGAAGAVASPETLRGRPIAAFCGIGNPAAFRTTLQGLGLTVAEFLVFPDHHAYPPADVEALHLWARHLTSGSVAITTQKDLTKLPLPRLGDKELWALRVRLEIETGQDTLDRCLRQVLGVPC
jgi:tetraacyldisaccharide 4'-kinase